MNIVTARLKKLVTDDGLMEVNDGVPVGRTYVVDLDTRRPFEMFHKTLRMVHSKDMVECVDGGWLPIELLDIDA